MGLLARLTSSRHPEEKRAGVFVREGLWLIHGSGLTTAGFYISQPPYMSLADDAKDEQIGEAHLKALEASRAKLPVPDPRDLSDFKPVLELASVGGWRKFSQTAAAIGVQARRKVVTITPERKKGPQGNLSFEAMTDRSIEITDPTPADLGTALRAAYERTE